MKNAKQILYTLIILCCSHFSFAQVGNVTGKVLDGAFNNEPLAFASVTVKGTSKGITSDFDGNYNLELEPGTYTLSYSFVGYETKEINNVVVTANTTITHDVSLNTNSLEEVIIKTSAKKNTENAVLNLQRKSVTLMDGLSAQTIKKTGASNLASAIKNVPGVSIEGGKYVYVRGLGDRYTKSILNGVDIPGLDPDRNTLQMDIFPTNILDNIIVIKSAAAEHPADFTGGIVDIVTKDFPTKAEYTFALSLGINPNMHFNTDYLSYTGSGTDFLGFDNGFRDLPINRYQPIPGTSENSTVLTTITNAFEKELSAKKSFSAPNSGFGFTAGNQYDVGENKLGYQVSFSYKNETEFYENRIDGIYTKDEQDSSNNNLLANRLTIGNEGINNVLLNGLAGLTYKRDKAKYKATFLHIQNGESSAGYFDQLIAGAGGNSGFEPVFKDALLYTQRSITNTLLNGTHKFGENNDWDLDWKLASTLSTVYDKDHRITPLRLTDNNAYIVDASFTTYPIRIWRYLTEENWSGKIDVDKKYTLFDNAAKVKFGGSYTYKFRDFSIDDFTFNRSGDISVANGNADNLLLTENIWTQNQNGTHLVFGDIFEPGNAYEGEQRIAAAYISNEFKMTEAFKAIIGIRAESFKSFYTGQNAQGDLIFDEEKIIDAFDFFPSANLIYSLAEKTNLRGSYYRTTARPSFKEASVSQIFDPITDTRFIGNINLEPTYVNNFDLRFERFGSQGQIIAISGFYKGFKDPIERTFFASDPSQFTLGNLGDAKVYGAEIEVRKHFGFVAESLENLKLNVNASLIKSELKMSNQEYNSRVLAARDGESIDKKRDLQGQAPYLINAGLDYSLDTIGLQTGLYYNVQGETLEVVGINTVPDIYTKPFSSLNLTITKALDKEDRASLSFKATNLLGSVRESVYDSYGISKSDRPIFSKRVPFREFSLGFSYKF